MLAFRSQTRRIGRDTGALIVPCLIQETVLTMSHLSVFHNTRPPNGFVAVFAFFLGTVLVL